MGSSAYPTQHQLGGPVENIPNSKQQHGNIMRPTRHLRIDVLENLHGATSFARGKDFVNWVITKLTLGLP